MAHYAWVNSDNTVINVSVGVDESIIQQGVGGSTEAWETFYTNAVNQQGVFIKRTSYNTHGNVHSVGGNPYRKNYAGIGYTYDTERDAFIAPQPYPSWILDEATCRWQAPVPMPTPNPPFYSWDEATLSWIEITE